MVTNLLATVTILPFNCEICFCYTDPNFGFIICFIWEPPHPAQPGELLCIHKDPLMETCEDFCNALVFLWYLVLSLSHYIIIMHLSV